MIHQMNLIATLVLNFVMGWFMATCCLKDKDAFKDQPIINTLFVVLGISAISYKLFMYVGQHL